MSTIRILSDQVANRIAAGEVIERPVAVVKELVDNSIDAGADRIRIQFKQGGKSYVLVEDNGKGMTPDDALLSLERHATSKIQNSDDLFNIHTLGFRGEAIPSVASVSRFLMRTRTEDQLEGTEILVNGGKLIHRKDVGMAPGTRIEVTHLFSSIPARRKFLKTDNTEASHIIHWMRLIAVAHPKVAFRLLSNDRTLMSLPVHENPLDRILALWGREFENQLESLEFEANGIKASGYIGKSGVSRPSRQDMVTIVNGRPVESRTLGFAFTEAFHTHIPKGRYPMVFLQIEIDPSMIDVNIHPSKKEIKFKNESNIRTLIIQNVWKVLRANHSIAPTTNPIPENATGDGHSSLQKKSTASSTPEGQTHALPRPTGLQHSPAPIQRTETVSTGGIQNPPSTKDLPSARTTICSPSPSTSAVAIEQDWRFIGDYHRSYSLFERAGGLSILHNSRALRRIGYEKVLSEFNSGKQSVQHDIVPTTLELEAHTSDRLKKMIPLLSKCGLVVEEFGRNFFRIEAVPAMMQGADALQLIEKWLHQDFDHQLDLAAIKTGIALICAGKYRQQLELPLRKEVAIDVLRQLLKCEQPMVDPEGATIIQHIPHRVIEGSQTKPLENLPQG